MRRRLQKLEETVAADTVEVVCPECGAEFRVDVDTGLAYLVWEWTQSTGESGYWKAPPDVLRVVDHPHDASAFVLKEDRSPWLGEFSAT